MKRWLGLLRVGVLLRGEVEAGRGDGIARIGQDLLFSLVRCRNCERKI